MRAARFSRPALLLACALVLSARSHQTRVNVRAFGATGDGHSDDSAAIQRAVVASVQGGTVFFPRGNYRLTKKINLASGRTYQGEEGTILTSPPWDFAFSTPYNSTDSIAIRNLVFEAGGISLDGTDVPASNVDISECTFQNIQRTGENWPLHSAIFAPSGLSKSRITHNKFTNILEGGKLDAVDREASGIRAWRIDRVEITDNVFDLVNQAISLGFDGPGPYTDVLIARNTGTRIHRMGIEAQGKNTINLRIENNQFLSFESPFWNTFGLSIAVDGGHGTIIRNNVLVGQPAPPPSSRFGYGIEIGGQGTIATNNTVKGSFAAGIAIGTAPDANVSGNYLCGSPGSVQVIFEHGQPPRGAAVNHNISEPVCKK